MRRLILGSAVSRADEVGGELEKSLVSITLTSDRVSEFSTLFTLYMYLKIYVLPPYSLPAITVGDDTLKKYKEM